MTEEKDPQGQKDFIKTSMVPTRIQGRMQRVNKELVATLFLLWQSA